MNRIINYVCILAGFLILFGCSGSGSSSSQNTTPVQAPYSGSVAGSVTVANTALQFSETTSVSATFKKTDGTPASGININFSTTLGIITPASGISVTDANGTATVQLTVGATPGQGQVTASATVDNKQVTKTGLFSVSLPPLKLSAISLGLSTLSYGGSTSVSVTVTDADGTAFIGQEVDVTFSSTQAASGKATITSPVRTVSGVATVTYQATTVTGSDTITAAIVGDSKTATITVNPLNAGSISFVSALPTTIGLKGMGGAGILETSVVTFKVFDTSGTPKANQPITFSLNTKIGGISMLGSEPIGSGNPVTSSTGQDGIATIIVQSGTIATPVRVTATLQGTSPLIATQSDQLVVSTGVPAQDGFSISIANLNTESWSTDGVQDKVTARLSDHFHNPVPDGTAVYFTTSGGSIQPSCTTIGGACTVTWTSQNPRPIMPGSPTGLPSTGAKNDGRAVILAYAVGEEAFVDTNGNGVADLGEFTDTTGAFRDDNENGVLDVNEPFIPFNQTGVFDQKDGKYNGILQNAVDIAANVPRSKHVFSNSVIVMSSTVSGTVSFTPSSVALATSSSITTSVLTLVVTDVNGNVMPAGTVISVAGAGGAVSSSFSTTVPNTINKSFGASSFAVPVTCTSLTSGTSALTVSVRAPSGQSTIYSMLITY